MQLFTRFFLAITLILAQAGCGITKGKAVAARAVPQFHKQFNDGQFAKIYAAGTPALKSASTEADFLKLMEAVRRKLGAWKSSTAGGWRTNVTPSGTFVLLSYESTFERGTGTETFTYVVSGEGATLQGYNINSPALITN